MGFINKEIGAEVGGYTVVGNDEWLLNRSEPVDILFGIGGPRLKEELYHLYSVNNNISFPTVISTYAIVSDRIIFGKGCIVCAGTVMTVDINIGNFVTLNLNCTVGHDAVLEDFIQVNPSTNISGNVRIGKGCDVGTGVKIIQGKTIGENTVIGAGAVVTKDIPANCTAVGIPAKPLVKVIGD